MREIVLPDNVKPALEWVNGRALQKVSPRREHALAQGRFFAALDAWARKNRRGTVGTEWRFQVKPPGEVRRSLVPDVAFLSYERMPRRLQRITSVPRCSPDAVVEVSSPGDRRADMQEKVRVYLQAGTAVVFEVDPRRKIVAIRDVRETRIVRKTDVVTHDSLPGFKMWVRFLFEPEP
jgi:Uma2 family endonuclease